MDYAFHQIDVFSAQPLLGNPVAVVEGADPLTGAQMAALARWTNLSETTFLLRPTAPGADYRLRIFTPRRELPFAGHPTLGSCHAWLGAGGVPHGADIVQECGVGLVRVRRDGPRLAFAAPPLRKTGPLEPDLLSRIVQGLGLPPASVVDSHWIDNGPGWIGLLLDSRAQVLDLRPDLAALDGIALGVVAPWDPPLDGPEAQFEVRAFVTGPGGYEDPVTGSLNAGLAQWLIASGRAPPSYVASQGTVLGRAGRVHVHRTDGEVWVGGDTVTCIRGTLTL